MACDWPAVRPRVRGDIGNKRDVSDRRSGDRCSVNPYRLRFVITALALAAGENAAVCIL